MRMLHYYVAFAIALVPLLVIAPVTGFLHDGSQRHLGAGLLMAIGCVIVNTLAILFTITTGRVLKAAMKVRPLPPALLAELNEYFADRSAYPIALVAATLATATAVLGYGPNIGVPIEVHLTLGLVTVATNLASITAGVRALRRNQNILDRATRELDRLDDELGPAPPEAGEIDWRFGPSTRSLVFAACAWLPYLYWGAVVWRGEFHRVPVLLLAGSAIASLLGLRAAWHRARTG